MIEIIVTLYPRGDRSKPKRLQRCIIVNDGTGSISKGNYIVQFLKAGVKTDSAEKIGHIWKQTAVRGFPRKSKNVW